MNFKSKGILQFSLEISFILVTFFGFAQTPNWENAKWIWQQEDGKC